ncbi:MAG: cation:proton antiporter, partial [Xanthomonadales bacterium]|nr:cation:proton antiporter [Xanthomonadales bacterium]
ANRRRGRRAMIDTSGAVMMLAVAGIAILVAMGLALLRTLLGPTVHDRILAVNSFGTKTVLLIALLAAMAGRGDYLDVALLYALINFIGTVALMKYSERGVLRGQDEDPWAGAGRTGSLPRCCSPALRCWCWPAQACCDCRISTPVCMRRASSTPWRPACFSPGWRCSSGRRWPP